MAGKGVHVFRTRSLFSRLDLRPCVINVRTAFKRSDTPNPDPELFQKHVITKTEHMQREEFPKDFAVERPKGKIYDKKPFKIHLEAGKTYSWCTCGHSKSQPLCDGTHKRLDGTSFVKTQPRFRPLKFQVDETKERWLCNCKQTNNQPFCDGTHSRQDIQDAIKS